VHRVGDHIYVDGAGWSVELVESPRFPAPAEQTTPGSLTASMPGTVVKLAVNEGDRVVAGAPVVVLEAMKMEHTVTAPHDGTVTQLKLEVGQTVDVGAILAVVEEDA
jgi:propionyl-CoA carboxylase alpha chain